jgi:hypothetical protein
MTFLVDLMLYGWIPVVIYLFIVMPPRRAVIASFLIAWLFLPMAGYKVLALPDYTKMSATCFGVMLAATIFDPDPILRFRPKWVDLPIAVFCISPFFTSVLNEINGSGVYDGLSVMLSQIVTWGLPYFIGRVYFDDLASLRELAIGIFIGGLVYMPFCWIEMRMSPQLHRWIYGFHQHGFIQTIRLGGYRPMVFMQHGLMVAMWMAMSALIGIWLWNTGALRKIWDIPMYALVPVLFITAVFCRSMFAFALLMLGIGLLFTAKWFRLNYLVAALLLFPPGFMLVRGSGLIEMLDTVQFAKDTFGEDRGGSLQTRVEAENALAIKAREQPWFGWGGWGRNRVANEVGREYITDSLWIINFGQFGIINLIGLTVMLLLPMILVIYDYRVELWSHPAVAPVVVLALINMLYMFDHLMNAMVNPIFMLAVGGVCAAHFNLPKRLPVPALWHQQQEALVRSPMRQPAYAAGRTG